MKSKKGLVQAIGPLVVASLLLGILLLSPFSLPTKPSAAEMRKGATSLSLNVIKGNTMKNTALASDHYLPFFGSSELSRVDSFHPSVLARKYKRDYEPFLLGAPGTQSLVHYFLINSLRDELDKRPIVFVISPQWFVKKGISDQYFSMYYSPLQTYQWLMNLDEITEQEKYLANRLLDFTSISSDTYLSTMLNKIKDGEPLSKANHIRIEQQFHLLSREDELFYKFWRGDKEKAIKKRLTYLPDNYNVAELDKIATKMGKDGTNNNDLELANLFYSSRVAPARKKLENSQVKYNYLKSPEYGDFQLVLDELAKHNIKPLFIIPPVNKKWSDFTGISEEMLNTFSKKITEQLTSQGFDQIADYTQERGVNYFMEDTIHLGWRGWLAVDQDLQKFLKNDQQPHYKINNEKYLSPEWAKEDKF